MPVLMTPSLLKSPAMEPPASLSPVESRSLSEGLRMDESLRVAFLRTLPIEEWECYQSELERKTDETWTRVALMESTWVLIRRYGTQFVMTVGLNQPIMREVIEEMMEFTEYDGQQTDSVTDESAEESPFMGDQPNK